MNSHIDIVPKWIRIIVGILAIMNIAFGIMGYFNSNILFHEAINIDLANMAIKNASFDFAARNLAIGIALGIVALKGVPESITIVMIIRALIEIQTIVIALFQGNMSATLFMPLAFLTIEILVIKKLIEVIQKRDAQ